MFKETSITENQAKRLRMKRLIKKTKRLIPKKKFVQHYIARKPKSTINYFNKGFGGDLE